MGHQNIVDLGFDIEAISKEQQEVVRLFVDLFGKLEEYDGTKINPLKSGGLADLRKSIQDGAKAMGEFQQIAAKYNQTVVEQSQKQAANKKSTDDLTLATKEYQKTQDQLAQTQAKNNAATSDAAAGLAVEREALRQRNAELRESAKQQLSEIGSINEARASVAQLIRERDQLNLTTEEGKARQAEINKEIDKQNEFIRVNVSLLEKQKINIGNYPGAFKDAFKTLATQLDGLKSDFAASGGADPAQAKNIETIENVLAKLNQGFATTRQESRAFAEAVTQVGLALGDKSKEFLEFNKAVGHTQNAINDLKAATKFQSQDAKLLVGLADAANTVAGAYGAWSAATEIVAGDDEDLQKQMAGFQRLLLLINGLQSVANGLQTESAGIQLVLSARTNLLNAAKSVQLLITSKAVEAVAAENAATAENAVAKEADAAATAEQAAAQEAATAATVQNTEATAANTAATGAAAGATKTLTTSLIAGGLAVLLIGAGVALALLTAKLVGYGEQVGITVKQQKELADAAKELNDTLASQQKIFDDLDDSTKRYYAGLIGNAQAAGANQYSLLLAQIASDKASAAAAEQLRGTDAEYVKAANDIQKLNNNILEYAGVIEELNKIPEKDLTGDQKKQIKAAQDNIQLARDQISAIQPVYDRMTKARNDFKDFTQKAQEGETRFNKLANDEQLEVTEKAEELRASLVKARNAIILGDERSTLKQRLEAMASNLRQENAILDAQAAKIKNNPSNFINGLLTPQAQSQLDTLNDKRRENDIAAAEATRKEIKKVRDQQAEDALQAFKDEQDAIINEAQRTQQGLGGQIDLLNGNKRPSIGDRSAAIAEEAEAQRKILQADRDAALAKIDNTVDNQDKIREINLKFANDQRKLDEDTVAKYLDLQKFAHEQAIAEWKKYYQERENQIEFNEIDQLRNLEEARNRDLINLREYNRQKQKIEDEGRLAKAQGAVQDAYVEVNATKRGTTERAAAEAHLAETVKDLNNQVSVNHQHAEDSKREKVIKTLDDIETAYQNLSNAVGNILDISTESQKAKIEELEATQQKNYESQISAIQASTVSEEEKAARVAVLEKQRMAQKEANDRRERQLEVERAQFQKAASITSIILDTTKAIIGFLHDPGGFAGVALSVAAGITGAAQLAKAVATQVPHYKFGAGINGRPLHPGGPFVAGDGGEQELISEPGKRPYLSPAVPTLLNAAPMTSVIPISRLDNMSRMWVTDQGILTERPNNAAIEDRLDRLNNAIGWLGGVVKESAKNNRPRVTVINNIGKDLAHAAWVRKNIFD